MSCKLTRNKKNAAIATAGAAVLLVGSSFAFFMDKESVTNPFTVGNVKITVTEEHFDETTARDITPNKVIPKDPVVTNTGVNDVYAFVSVKVPKANVETANADGTLNAAKNQDLFTYKVNDNWKLIKTNDGDAHSEYIYAYSNADGSLKKLAKNEKTNAVFDSVKFINIVDEQQSGVNLNIDVNGIGIQTADLGTDNPLQIYGIAVNHSKAE